MILYGEKWLLGLVVASVLFPYALTQSLAMEVLPGMEKAQLSNGLTAIVKESHRAPVVAVEVWVQAGSVYETDAEAGLTHVIEHMIFKGTQRRGPGEVAREIESVGGGVNAHTSSDYTVYHCVVPRQFLDKALDVLSDAVFHSTFDPGELEREKKVILEEIRMREDRPESRMSRLLMETAYKGHPYRRPVIGFPQTVSSFTQKDIQAYMARRYRPAHMAVVVVGDVAASQALSRVQEVFGAAAAAERQGPMAPTEPPQREPRLAMEEMEVQEAYLSLAFSGVPGFNDPDTPVMDVLGALMGGGESSRLNLTLRDRLQLVHNIDASAFTPAGPGVFIVTATLEPEKVSECLARVLRELLRLRYEEVIQEELDRAKILVQTAFVYDQETMEGEARKLGLFQTLARDPAAEQVYLERLQRVTPQDLQRVANRVFQPGGLSVVMLAPQRKTPALAAADLITLTQEADLAAHGIESSPAGELVYPARRTTLSNGLTVLVREAPEVPTVAVRLVFPGGVRYETEENNGLFSYLVQAWTRGTENRSAQGLAEAVEGMGGQLTGFSGQNTFGLQAAFLSPRLDQGLALLAEVVLTPAFSPDEVDRLRPIVLSQFHRQDDYLPGVAFREFRRLLFSPHPYSLDPLGKEDALQRLGAEDLHRAYRRHAVPDRGVLSIVGNVRAEEVISSIQTLFGGWAGEAEEAALPAPPPPEPLTAARFLSLKRDKQQVHMVLGFPGTTFKDPDRYPLEVLNAVLSGQGGRLFQSLRDTEGLAYSVTSSAGLGLDYGSFAFYIACAPEKREIALKGLWREIYRVVQSPIPAEELERAKRWLIGSHEIGLQTNGDQALDMALNELYGLGFNFAARYGKEIERVDAASVQAIAAKLLKSEAYVLVRVGS